MREEKMEKRSRGIPFILATMNENSCHNVPELRVLVEDMYTSPEVAEFRGVSAAIDDDIRTTEPLILADTGMRMESRASTTHSCLFYRASVVFETAAIERSKSHVRIHCSCFSDPSLVRSPFHSTTAIAGFQRHIFSTECSE